MSEEANLPDGITAEDWARTPRSVRQLIVDQGREIFTLRSQSNLLTTQVADLNSRVEKLLVMIKTDSHNSGRPPSSDPPSAPKYPKHKPSGKQRGGQKHHIAHQRPDPLPEQITRTLDYKPTKCTNCQIALSNDLPDLRKPEIRYTYELPQVKPLITEHRLHAARCPDCGRANFGEPEAKEMVSEFGPRLHAVVALLRVQGISMGQSVLMLKSLFGVEVGKSSIAKICYRVSNALESAQLEAEKQVEQAEIVNTDETGWVEEAKAKWLWIHLIRNIVLYRISSKRNKSTMAALLGVMFIGIVCSDRLGIYNSIPAKRRQICLAHLSRNFILLSELSGKIGAWGKRGVIIIDDVFNVWHQFQRGDLTRKQLKKDMKSLKNEMEDLLDEGKNSTDTSARRMSLNLSTNFAALWTFTEVEGVEPTNNSSERGLRRAVIWRGLSHGTQSDYGTSFVERMLTVWGTCQMQKRDALAFIYDSILAHWSGNPAPSLLPLANQ